VIMSDHVLEIFLTFRRKFVLILHRPARQIPDAIENECRLRSCRLDLLCTEWDAPESQQDKKPGANSHSSKTRPAATDHQSRLWRSCRRRRRWNWRRNPASFSPACPMQDENDQPKREREQPAGNSNKHQPAEHTQRIQKLAIIFSIYDAGMHQPFVHFAAVESRERGACHPRSSRRKREENDEDENDPIKNPRETFLNRQRWRVHCRGCVLLNPAV